MKATFTENETHSACTKFATFAWCVTNTPFGLPVVPLEYNVVQISPPLTWTFGAGGCVCCIKASYEISPCWLAAFPLTMTAYYLQVLL